MEHETVQREQLVAATRIPACDEDRRIARNAIDKLRCMSWRMFFIQALGAKCSWPGCDEIEKLEIDHIVPVPKNAMSGAGKHERIADWKRQFLKGNLQLLCKRHNIEKREYDKEESKVSEELKFEGVMEKLDEIEKESKKYAFVKCAGSDLVFSVFDTKIIDKLKGAEGKRLAISYWKSIDGKYNNVSQVQVEGNQDDEMRTLVNDAYEDAAKALVKLDKIRVMMTKS